MLHYLNYDKISLSRFRLLILGEFTAYSTHWNRNSHSLNECTKMTNYSASSFFIIPIHEKDFKFTLYGKSVESIRHVLGNVYMRIYKLQVHQPWALSSQRDIAKTTLIELTFSVACAFDNNDLWKTLWQQLCSDLLPREISFVPFWRSESVTFLSATSCKIFCDFEIRISTSWLPEQVFCCII